jgi:protein-S-isoprenylcysteine O-methyltransferase Ste14
MDRRRLAALATVAFGAVAPGTVAGVIPWRLANGCLHPPLGGARVTRWLGTGLIAAGAPLVASAFVRFVRAAGTPAPVFETESLVVTGPYRYTRNPQYVGVVTIVAGEGLLYGSRRVLAYSAALWAAFNLWVRVYEEPRLRQRFGADYDTYVRTVPRWLLPPRRRKQPASPTP